jgi:hypothetical protein
VAPETATEFAGQTLIPTKERHYDYAGGIDQMQACELSMYR